MNQPILSIDVSKSTSFAASFITQGQPFKKPISFDNSITGMNSALKLVKNLEQKSKQKPKIILEATGNFSKPIKAFFQNQNYKVIELNPIQTHNQKRTTIRKVKTDPIDANRIAHVYYSNKINSKPQIPKIPEHTLELRNLCRQYDKFTKSYRSMKLSFGSIIDLLFPKFDSVFTNICCKTALNIISHFPTPESILSADKNRLKSLMEISNHNDIWIENKIDKLMAAARESLSFKVAQQSNIQVLKHYTKMLLTYQEVLADLRAQIKKTAELSSAFPLLLSIPGVGELTAATIIGEIGCVSRFPTVKQLVAYSGLDPSVYQSGRFKASNNKISKRGSPYLRKALYQATQAATRKYKGEPNNQTLYDYYTKKVSAGKHTKVARIATCSKLLRIIYGMWKNKEFFRVK